ncbi:MAG TPA: urea ABC transporter permease subunit UrtC [Phycisphaerae bacterium]|nr:urea ABC transporter permease subunit UrtC [Phycisphaerae bacterium]
MLYATGAMGITAINQLGRFLSLVIVALGMDLVWGYAGILSLCQAMFFCFGGYAIGMYLALHGPLDGNGVPTALSVVSSTVGGIKLPWFWKPFASFPSAILLGMLVTGGFAFVFGYFTFRSRVRGVYFSIITQALTVALLNVFRLNDIKLCGTNGLTNFVTILGYDLRSPATQVGLYLATSLAVIASYLGCRWLVGTRLGRLLKAVRDNESRLRFAGFQPVTFKIFVFLLGALMAAVGGMLYTPQNGIITPSKMEAVESITIVAFVAVGGRGTLTGAVIGALVVSYLNSLLTSGFFYGLLPGFLRMPADGVAQSAILFYMRRPLQILLGADGWLFVLGGIFVGITLFMPQGIVGAWRRLLSHGRTGVAAAVEEDADRAHAEEGSVDSSAVQEVRV